MAKFDIMPFNSVLGGTYGVSWNQMTTGEVFETGEPVMVVTAGTLTEPTDNGAEVTVAQFQNGLGGIAAIGPGAGNINPATGIAFAALDDIAYWPFGQGNQFITRNYFNDGATAAVVPDQTDVGMHFQMVYSATVGFSGDAGWGLNETAALSGVDLVCLVTEVLDAEKAPIRITGNTGVYLVFEIDKPTLAAA